MTDEGSHLSNAWHMVGPHISDYEHNWISWLTYLLGGYWLRLTTDLGMFGARLGWNVVVGLLAWVTFKILCEILSSRQACFYVILATFVLLHRGFKVIDYHNLPALLLIGAVGGICFSQKQSISASSSFSAAIWGGLLLGFGVMARFPFVLTLFFPFVAPLLFRIYGISYSSRVWKAASLSLLASGIAIFLGIWYLHAIGFLSNYLETLYSTFRTVRSEYHHSMDHLSYLTLLSVGKSLILALAVGGTAFFLVVGGWRIFPKTLELRIALLTMGLLGVFITLRIYTATAGFHLFLWGFCTLSAGAYLLFCSSIRKKFLSIGLNYSLLLWEC